MEAVLLASVAAQPASILWGWAEQYGGRAAHPLAERFLGYFRDLGEPHLGDDELSYGFDASEDQGAVIAAVAHDVGMTAVEILGGRSAYYTFPVAGGTRGVLALPVLPDIVPMPTATDVAYGLQQMLPAIDDLDRSLTGLARLNPSWRLERLQHGHPRTRVWHLVDPGEEPDTLYLLAGYDARGHLERFDVADAYEQLHPERSAMSGPLGIPLPGLPFLGA